MVTGGGAFAGVEIGAQVVAGNAGRSLDLEDVVSGKRATISEPTTHGCLRPTDHAPKCALRPSRSDRER